MLFGFQNAPTNVLVCESCLAYDYLISVVNILPIRLCSCLFVISATLTNSGLAIYVTRVLNSSVWALFRSRTLVFVIWFAWLKNDENSMSWVGAVIVRGWAWVARFRKISKLVLMAWQSLTYKVCSERCSETRNGVVGDLTNWLNVTITRAIRS